MSPLRIISLAATIAFSLSPRAFAQENAPGQDGMTEKPAALQQNGTSGTAPEGAGSTGWTGGTGGSFIGTQHQGSDASPNAQPELATGVDLKGPPSRFPAGKSPE
jgi:hypothetical protein